MLLPGYSDKDKDYDSLVTRLRFFGTLVPVSLAASLQSIYSDGTKLGLERSTSKMTSGSVATRESARGQTPRGGSLSFGARIKGGKRFRYPKRSISRLTLCVPSIEDDE
jgi:hypothetical protein